MAWETRNGSGRYYTRSHRVNGRIAREYVGTGLIGELAASEDAVRRAKRERQCQAWNAERNRLEALESTVDRFSAGVSALTTAVLVNAGFHRHHRGEWRKRRV